MVQIGNLQSEEIGCVACSRLPENAVEATCCGSLYCSECSDHAEVCAMCEAERPSFRPNLALQRIIEKMEVLCSHEGCSVKAPMKLMKAHEAQCEYQLVGCPRSAACGLIAKALLDDHLSKSCVYRVVECPCNCGVSVAVVNMENHLANECDGLEIDCAFQCGSKVKAKERNQHLAVCPEAPVVCEFKDLGCGVTFRRKDYDEHQEAHSVTHVRLLKDTIVQQSKEIEALKATVTTMQSSSGFTNTIKSGFDACWFFLWNVFNYLYTMDIPVGSILQNAKQHCVNALPYFAQVPSLDILFGYFMLSFLIPNFVLMLIAGAFMIMMIFELGAERWDGTRFIKWLVMHIMTLCLISRPMLVLATLLLVLTAKSVGARF